MALRIICTHTSRTRAASLRIGHGVQSRGDESDLPFVIRCHGLGEAVQEVRQGRGHPRQRFAARQDHIRVRPVVFLFLRRSRRCDRLELGDAIAQLTHLGTVVHQFAELDDGRHEIIAAEISALAQT